MEKKGRRKKLLTPSIQMAELADELGLTMAEVSLAWLIAQPGVTSVIAGARRASHARTSARQLV